MKKYLAPLFILVAFSACKKETEIEPEDQTPVEVVAGDYELASFKYETSTLDLNFTRIPSTVQGIRVTGGTIEVEEGNDDDMVDLTCTVEIEGEDDVVYEYELEVKEKGGEYGLYSGKYKVADCDGKTIDFEAQLANQQTKEELTIGFTGKKR